MLKNLLKDLKYAGNKDKAGLLKRYFKTDKGEYGEGDIFLGINVPKQREICRRYIGMPLTDIQKLLDSKIHEHRLCGLFILIDKYNKSNEKDRINIVNFYLSNTHNINNWDLVDTSASYILGKWLLNKDKKILYKLAKSKSLWERRIAIIATYSFIRTGHFEDTISISEILLRDKHDLIHKAVGWMLREVGKKDLVAEEKFLRKYYKIMPRTMLRYAIERFSKEKRIFYMSKG